MFFVFLPIAFIKSENVLNSGDWYQEMWKAWKAEGKEGNDPWADRLWIESWIKQWHLDHPQEENSNK